MKTKIFLSIFILFIISVVFLNSVVGTNKFQNLKALFNQSQKKTIKKYVFPYKFIFEQQNKIADQQATIDKKEQELLQNSLEFELFFKQTGSEINLTRDDDVKLSNNLTLKKFKLDGGFYTGIQNTTPGTGYIDFYEDNIFIVSARGILAYKKNLTNVNSNFKQIKNNINDFIGYEQFIERKRFSVKDILISKNKIFISYTEEIKDDCWNTSLIHGDVNYESIKFKKLFISNECIKSKEVKEFVPNQSGGRIIPFDDSNILLTVGDYRNRHLAQIKESINGKIIKVDINTSAYEIISMGHRNPQGLYFDKEKNFILSTEHGPKGGDEINLIEVEKINKNEILNFGWPVSSYGEHYGNKKDNKFKYEKFPLHKSHSDYGFIEPIKAFVPSIGISEIVKIENKKYVVSSMKDQSLYFFEIGKENKSISNLQRVEVFERVRDLRIKDKKLYLFLEDTASIGLIDLL